MAARFALSCLLVMVLVVPAVAGHMPPPPPNGSVWTVRVLVEADVVDSYARVKVIADIGNRGPDPEFPFAVEVPATAMVTGLTLTRDGQSFEAAIKPRETARAEYDAQKKAELTAGLVEKQRASTVYSYLVNVAAFESVRAELRYEQYLAADNGSYQLHLSAPVSGFGLDLGASFNVRLNHRDGIGAAWSVPAGHMRNNGNGWQAAYSVDARHTDAATPFDVLYTTLATPDGGSMQAVRSANGGFFAHRFQARSDGATIPVDLVMVLDVSGSMTGTKVAQMQDAAVQVIQGLRPADRLHLVFFSTTNVQPWQGMKAVDAQLKADAVKEVKAVVAAGGTGIEAALRAATGLVDPNATRMPVVMFLTDGRATVGKTDATTLLGLAKEVSRLGGRLFSLGFGADADAALVTNLAREGGGLGVLVPEGAGAEVDLRRFMAAVTTPVLRDVQVTYKDGVQGFTTTVPVLYAGSELLWVGTIPAGVTKVAGTVTARAADGPRTYTFSADVPEGPVNGTLERLVAFARIQRNVAALAGGQVPELVDEVRSLALRYGFVTDYTSLVIGLDAPTPGGNQGMSPRDTATRPPGASWSAPPATSMSWAPTTGAPVGGSWSGSGLVEGDGRGGPVGSAPGPAGSTTTSPTPVPFVVAVAALALALVVRRRLA